MKIKSFVYVMLLAVSFVPAAALPASSADGILSAAGHSAFIIADVTPTTSIDTTTINSITPTTSINTTTITTSSTSPSTSSSSTTSSLPYGWFNMASGTTESLYGVWGSSGSDVFAVGANGSILHYDGSAWSVMTKHSSVLYDIYGSSGSNVFAATTNGTILQYDGTHWLVKSSGLSKPLYGIWCSSNSDVFAVGDSGTILHYDGSTWSPMTSGATEHLAGVWGSSGSDVFAVGFSGTILHYDGSTWSPMTSGTTNDIYEVWGFSNHEVFAVGVSGTILYYNGTVWNQLVSGTVYNISDIWGVPGGEVFAVTTNWSESILHYNGSTWSAMSSGKYNYHSGVWGSSGTNVFTVGDSGVIMHYGGPAPQSTTTTTIVGVSTTTSTAPRSTTSTASGSTTSMSSTSTISNMFSTTTTTAPKSTSSITSTTTSSAPSAVKAIIVAGGSMEDSLWPATSMLANRAYKALRLQGFSSGAIYYLTPDTKVDVDHDSAVDYDARPTIENLKYALTDWAKNAQEVVIYLVDHGGDKTFKINKTQTLQADDLKEWLDELQDAIPGKVVFVYEACQSGSFLTSLVPPAGKQRILIASASSDEPAILVRDGQISFSYYLWNEILQGVHLYKAFINAKQSIELTSDQKQHALLDDNGNGVGNEKDDGNLAWDYTVGQGKSNYPFIPEIVNIVPDQTLEGSGEAPIWVTVSSEVPIKSVCAVIRRPDQATDDPSQPVTDLPGIEMENIAGTNKYQGTYGEFTINGTYYISVYATDDNDNISLPMISHVEQTGGSQLSTTTTTAEETTTTTTVTRALPCPPVMLLHAEPGKVALLHRFRDELLQNTPAGREYINLFYKHRAEITSILVMHPELIAPAQESLHALLPAIEYSLSTNKLIIAQPLRDRLLNSLNIFDAEAGPELRDAMEHLKHDLNQGIPLYNK